MYVIIWEKTHDIYRRNNQEYNLIMVMYRDLLLSASHRRSWLLDVSWLSSKRDLGHL